MAGIVEHLDARLVSTAAVEQGGVGVEDHSKREVGLIGIAERFAVLICCLGSRTQFLIVAM